MFYVSLYDTQMNIKVWMTEALSQRLLIGVSSR